MSSDRSLSVALFFSYAYFFQGGFDNQNSRFDLSLAVAFEHRLAIDTFAANTIDKAKLGEHFYCEKAPGTSLLALPIAVLATAFVSIDDILRRAWVGNLLLYGATLTLSAVVAYGALRFRRSLRLLRPDIDEAFATALTLTIFVATLILPYATMLMGHALAAALLAMGLSYGLERRPFAAGLAFGAATFVEFPDAVLAVAGFAAVLGSASPEGRRREALWMLAAAGVFCVLLGAYNTLAFGRPWVMGYASLSGSPFAETMAQGFMGIRWPRPSVIAQLLIGEYRGLFVYSPVLVLSLVAIPFWPRTERLRVLLPLLLGCVALVLLHSGYGYWQGGVAYGPRHLVAMVPFLGVVLVFFPARVQALFAVLAIASLLLSLLGTATTPFVDEHDVTPLRGSYWRLLQAGAVSASPRNFATPSSEASLHWLLLGRYPNASFNLGELVGLRSWTSLLPLFAVWLAFWLWHSKRET